MGFNFRKRIKVMPGVTLNVGKTGVSTTLGKRGASVTVGKRGTRATVGIPGTGLSYSQKLSGNSKKQNVNEFVDAIDEQEEVATYGEEEFKADMERAKKLYTWANVRCLLWNVIALPLLAFLVFGLMFTPFVGIFPAVIAAIYGIYKFAEKTKDI